MALRGLIVMAVMLLASTAQAGFIAVGQRGAIQHSEDGTTWELRESPTTTTLRSVSPSDGSYYGTAMIVAANGTVLTSIDTIAWQIASTHPGHCYRRVHQGGHGAAGGSAAGLRPDWTHQAPGRNVKPKSRN